MIKNMKFKVINEITVYEPVHHNPPYVYFQKTRNIGGFFTEPSSLCKIAHQVGIKTLANQCCYWIPGMLMRLMNVNEIPGKAKRLKTFL